MSKNEATRTEELSYVRPKTFECLSDIESDLNVRISELLEKIEI